MIPTVLVFEPDHRGHQAEYIEHLIRYTCAHDVQVRLVLLVHPDLVQKISGVVGRSDSSSSKVQIETLNAGELADMEQRGRALRDWNQWSIIQQRAANVGASHVLSLQLDFQQLALSAHRNLPRGCDFSGILFRAPSVPHRRAREAGVSALERLRDRRKWAMYRLMFLNRRLRVVFSFDPAFAEHAQRRLKGGEKVVVLRDPVPVNSDKSRTRPALQIDDGPTPRKRLLLFGSLSDRKGVFQTMDALKLLDPSIQERLFVTYAGQIQSADREKFVRRFEQLQATRGKLELRWLDAFLSDEELSGLIAASDLILAPYQRHVGSSGVVLRAAAAGKPVLTQNYGLVGSTTRQHHLGLTVDTSNPVEIARGITTFVEGSGEFPFSSAAAKALAQKHRPEEFAADILSHLLSSAVGANEEVRSSPAGACGFS